VFGLTLLLPRLAERLTRPLVNAGSRLSNSRRPTAARPCLVVPARHRHRPAVGAVRGPDPRPRADRRRPAGRKRGTTLLLLAYAAGAATSLAVALLIGGRVFTAMKRSLGAGEWVRRGSAWRCWPAWRQSLGLDTGILTRVSTVATGGLEQRLVDTGTQGP
jgi:hypothetical protein